MDSQQLLKFNCAETKLKPEMQFILKRWIIKCVWILYSVYNEVFVCTVMNFIL